MIKEKSRIAESKHSRQIECLRHQGQIIAIAAPLCVAVLPMNSLAQVQQTGVIRIEASGFDSGSGHAIAMLFLPVQDVLRHGHLETIADIRGAKASSAVPTHPASELVAVVFRNPKCTYGARDQSISISGEAL